MVPFGIHPCVRRSEAAKPVAPLPHAAKPAPIKSAECVPNKRVPNTCVPNAKGTRRRAEAVKRVRRWRKTYAEQHRDYMRVYMRRWRAMRRELAPAA
jgi:hypothetical protein